MDSQKKVLLRVESLGKKFPGFEAFRRLDLEIFEGQCMVIAGANG